MDLKVFLKMDGSGFQQGLTSAQQAVGKFAGAGLGALKRQLAAAFGIGAIAAFTKKTIDFAGRLRDVSDNLGVNIEWLQKMNYSAGQAGASMEDLGKFIQEVNRAREEALKDPKGKSAAALGRFGFSSSDISGMNTQGFIDRLIKQFSGGASVQMQNDLIEVGGRSAKKLTGAFMAGIDESFKPMTDEVADAVDEAGDAFFRLGVELMTEFAPAIVSVSQLIVQVIRDIVNVFAALKEVDWKQLAMGAIVGGPVGVTSAIMDAWNKSAPARAENEKTWDERDAKANWASRQRAAARRSRESAAPDFDITAKPTKADVMKSDSLVSVGNFLGSSRGLVESVGRETNKILREHTGLFKDMITKLGNKTDIVVP